VIWAIRESEGVMEAGGPAFPEDAGRRIRRGA